METYPFVTVWEDEETVYSKLKEKGWTRKQVDYNRKVIFY